MLFLTKALMAIGLLGTLGQAVDVQTSPINLFRFFTSTYYAGSQNWDQSLTHMACSLNNVWYNADCWFKLKMPNGTQTNCKVELAVPKNHHIDLGMIYPMNLKNMSMGNKAELEWHSIEMNDHLEHHKWISFVDMDNCTYAQEAFQNTFSKHYSESFSHSFNAMYQNDDESLSYVMCNNHHNKDNIDCLFTLVSVNGQEKRCSETLYGYKGYSVYLKNPGNFNGMLGGKKVVLHWYRYAGDKNSEGITSIWKEWKVSIIDMDNCKNFVQLDFNSVGDDISGFNVLVYNDSFDVYVRSRELCHQQYDMCILRYDHKGQLIGDPISFDLKIYHQGNTMIVDRLNSSSGGLFTEIDYHNLYPADGYHLITTRLIRPDGSQTELFKNHFRPSGHLNYEQSESSDNGYYSLCSPHKEMDGIETDKLRCIQYKVDGHQLMNTTVPLKEWSRLLKIFNLRHGGIILVYFDYNDTTVREIFRKHIQPTIINVKIKILEKNGLIKTEANLIDLDLRLTNSNMDKRFEDILINHLETDVEYCFYFAYTREHYVVPTVFEYLKKCVNKF